MAAKSGEKLPHDLVVDILSRLPAPHLWPLRSVCKPWFRLIAKDPQFAKSNFDKSLLSKSNPSFIVALGEKESSEKEKKLDFYMATDHNECDKAIELKLPFLGDEHNFTSYSVYGVCNGMLCLCDKEKREVYIWNPLTNDHITIPYPVTPPRSSNHRQSTSFGFGYLQSVDEYKIIKLVSDQYWGELEWRTELSVYTLGKDSSWRIIDEDIPFDFSFKGTPYPQINEQVFCIARRDGEMPDRTLLIFDLKDESLSVIYRPPINDRSDFTSIQDLGGSLCIFNASKSKDVDMWMMKLDDGKCSLDAHITLGRPEVVGEFSVLLPLGVVACSGDIIVVKNQTELITYNLSTKSINPLKAFCCPIVNASAFSGSIISPRAINGAGQIGKEKGL